MENKADLDSSTEHDSHKSSGSDLLHPNAINGVVVASDFDSKCPGVSSNSNSTLSGSSPAYVSVEGTCADSKSADKIECASDGKCLSNSETSQIRDTEIKPESDSTDVDITQFSKEVVMDVDHAIDVNVAASHEVENPIAAAESVGPDSQSGNNLAESDLDQKCLFSGDRSCYTLENGNKPDSDSPANVNTKFTGECDIDNASDVGAAAQEVKNVDSVQEMPASESADKSAKSASGINCPSDLGMVNTAKGTENKQVSYSHIKDYIQPCKDADDMGDACSIDVNVAGSHEVEIVVSVERTVCSDSLQIETKAQLDSSVKDEVQPTKEVGNDDALAIDVNATAPEVLQPVMVQQLKCGDFQSGDKLVEDGVQSCRDGAKVDTDGLDNNINPFDEPEIPISVAGSIIADSELENKSAEPKSASERECLVSETDLKEPHMQHERSSDSPFEDNSLPCKADSSDDKHTEVAFSLGEITEENATDAGNGIPADPLTRFDSCDVSSSIQGAEGQKSSASSEAGSEAARCEESSLHPSNDVPAGKAESSSA